MNTPPFRVNGNRGVVTGKPLATGGSLGRNEATGRGLLFTLETWCEKNHKKMDGLTMAVQGFGNVGSVGSLLIHRQGVKVVCVGDINGTWYNPNGLDIEAMYVYANSHGRSLKGYTEAGGNHHSGYGPFLSGRGCALYGGNGKPA